MALVIIIYSHVSFLDEAIFVINKNGRKVIGYLMALQWYTILVITMIKKDQRIINGLIGNDNSYLFMSQTCSKLKTVVLIVNKTEVSSHLPFRYEKNSCSSNC